MNPQDLKQGQSYLILANYYGNDCDNDHHFIAVPSKSRFYLDERAVRQSVSLPSEPPTLVGSSPKYDPCRLLKKGDRVQVKRRNGRCNGKDGEYLREAFCLVAENEIPNELVRVYHNSTEYRLDPAYLDLITPVEELEPYEVTESSDYFAVENRAAGDEVATFWKEYHPNPKEAAETECARLNAAHRKKQN